MKSYILCALCICAAAVTTLAFPANGKDGKLNPKVWYGYLGFVDVIPLNDPNAENEVEVTRDRGQIFAESRILPAAVDEVGIEDLHREKREVQREELLQRR